MTVVEAEHWVLYFSRHSGRYKLSAQATWSMYPSDKQEKIRDYYYTRLRRKEVNQF